MAFTSSPKDFENPRTRPTEYSMSTGNALSLRERNKLANFRWNVELLKGKGHWLSQDNPVMRLAVTAFCGLILYFRIPDAFSHPQLWAEDGTIFFLSERTLGWRAFLETYSGYLHLIPRTVAWVSALLPYETLPAAYFAASVLLTLLTCWLVLSPRLHLPFKPLLAIAIVAVPHNGEVWGTITNIQWILPMGMLALVLLERDRKWLWIEAIYLLAAGLSGPFCIFLLPVSLTVAYLRRNRYDSLLAAIVAMCALIQGVLIVIMPSWTIAPSAHGLRLLLQVLTTRLAGSIFSGTIQAFQPNASLPICFLGGLVIAWIVVTGKYKLEKVAIGFFMGAILAGTFWKFRSALDDLLPLSWNERYFYIPKVMLLWLVIIALANVRARAVAAILLLLTAITTLSYPTRDKRPVRDWASYAKALRAGDTVDIPINPQPWVLHVPARR
jgi:hypothetical protein